MKPIVSPSEMASQIAVLFEDKKDADLTVLCDDGTTFQAHRCVACFAAPMLCVLTLSTRRAVLAARCAPLAAQLGHWGTVTSPRKESKQQQQQLQQQQSSLHIPLFSSAAVRAGACS